MLPLRGENGLDHIAFSMAEKLLAGWAVLSHSVPFTDVISDTAAARLTPFNLRIGGC